jgi:hypothetical protein
MTQRRHWLTRTLEYSGHRSGKATAIGRRPSLPVFPKHVDATTVANGYY